MKAASNHYNGEIFLNPVPTDVMKKGSFFRLLGKAFKSHPGRTPSGPLGPFELRGSFKEVPSNFLQVTWLGHSGNFIEIDGLRLLTDPLWYQRASPFKILGPKRFFTNPVPLNQMPDVDFIILSHDHYDHLDKAAIIKLSQSNIPIITMLNVGTRLKNWGVPAELIRELDWWDSVKLSADVTITAAPARHFSGRWINDRFKTLWGSFIIKGPHHSVYFGADSGYYEGFREIGSRFGPFDLTLLEIGAYNEDWPDIHMGPDNAVRAHLELNGRLLMPLHWGTFNLAFHPWKEPIERLEAASQNAGVKLLLPAPGEMYNVDKGAYNSQWWKQYA